MFTNELLYRTKIVDSLECPLCNNTSEAIEHAFLDCQKIHRLWRQVEFWSGMVLLVKIKISDSEKIVGTYTNFIIDTVILSTKKKTIG